MRALWFVPAALPAVREALGIVDLGNRGGWVTNAALGLAQEPDITLGVVWASPLVTEYREFSADGVRHFCIPTVGRVVAATRWLNRVPVLDRVWKLVANSSRREEQRALAASRRIIAAFRPDLIHVHGTEGYFGRLGEETRVPVVVSLQGILSAVVEVYWGAVPWRWRVRFLRELIWYARMRRNARRERQILARNRYFTGRTPWDREMLMRYHPGAVYFSDGARMLRREFYGPRWRPERITPGRIYTTITAQPYKGTDTLIEALARLRAEFPGARLRVGGHLPDSGYGRYLRQLIRRLGLEDRVELLGFVDAARIVQELLAAHAFVNCAYIENSPNSVAEAQRVGTPCIATAVGGTPSMVHDGTSGLLFPAGDAGSLARQLRRVFKDAALARSLSEGGYAAAEARGDWSSLVARQLAIYREILTGSAPARGECAPPGAGEGQKSP